MEFDLAYKITEFREAQSGYYDENGKRYSSTPIGDEKAELMLQIINELESALIKVEEREQMNNEALLEIGGFAKYLIMVGMRSLEYTHDDKTIFDNIEYFKLCKKHNLSAYKALLFLQDYIDGDYKF